MMRIVADIRKTQRRLLSFSGLIRKELTRDIKRISFLVERGAKINAPVRTGRLRSSIRTFLGTFKAEVIPTVDYAIYVHEGTRFMRPRPFLKDALEDVKVGNIVHAGVRRALK